MSTATLEAAHGRQAGEPAVQPVGDATASAVNQVIAQPPSSRTSFDYRVARDA